LLKFSSTRCSDDRDRIFALLGIANDIVFQSSSPSIGIPSGFANQTIRFTPDYNLPVSQVYREFAISALAAAHPFGLLHCAGAFRRSSLDPARTMDLPSWVPDWRLPLLFKPFFKTSSFRAGKSKSKKSKSIQVISTGLSIVGVYLGRVRRAEDRSSGNFTTGNDRVYFELEDGSAGAAPPDTIIGDDVFIFIGANTPFVVRSRASQGTFNLIGDCYVRGVMNGEALEHEWIETTEICLV
jgi:hypothetical protein